MLERALDCLIKLLNNYQLNGFLDEMKIFLICFSNPSVKFFLFFLFLLHEKLFILQKRRKLSSLVNGRDGKIIFLHIISLNFSYCSWDAIETLFNLQKLELNVAATQLFIKNLNKLFSKSKQTSKLYWPFVICAFIPLEKFWTIIGNKSKAFNFLGSEAHSELDLCFNGSLINFILCKNRYYN